MGKDDGCNCTMYSVQSPAAGIRRMQQTWRYSDHQDWGRLSTVAVGEVIDQEGGSEGGYRTVRVKPVLLHTPV